MGRRKCLESCFVMDSMCIYFWTAGLRKTKKKVDHSHCARTVPQSLEWPMCEREQNTTSGWLWGRSEVMGLNIIQVYYAGVSCLLKWCGNQSEFPLSLPIILTLTQMSSDGSFLMAAWLLGSAHHIPSFRIFISLAGRRPHTTYTFFVCTRNFFFLTYFPLFQNEEIMRYVWISGFSWWTGQLLAWKQ